VGGFLRLVLQVLAGEEQRTVHEQGDGHTRTELGQRIRGDHDGELDDEVDRQGPESRLDPLEEELLVVPRPGPETFDRDLVDAVQFEEEHT